METTVTEKISNKDKVIALNKTIETGDKNTLNYIHPKKYTQHNLATADGIEGLKAYFEQVPPGIAKVSTVRIFHDGNYIFCHSLYEFHDSRKCGFDIFKFEDNKVVEHWDNIQDMPGPNESGHTMIDGEEVATDLEKKERNKALAKNFVEDFLVHGNIDKIKDYIDGDKYIQHNPMIGDGLSALTKAIEEWAKQGITPKYDKIHKVLGQGNFVLVVSEGHMNSKHSSFYDLFRVENGKIAEHWDTIETIPPRSEWKNKNGKF